MYDFIKDLESVCDSCSEMSDEHCHSFMMHHALLFCEKHDLLLDYDTIVAVVNDIMVDRRLGNGRC